MTALTVAGLGLVLVGVLMLFAENGWLAGATAIVCGGIWIVVGTR